VPLTAAKLLGRWGGGWGWRKTSEAGGRRQQRGKEGSGGRREGEEGRRGGERGRGVGTAIAPHNSEAAGRVEVTEVANFSIEEPVALHIAFQVVLVTMLRFNQLLWQRGLLSTPDNERER
jgi:hypothetical protein